MNHNRLLMQTSGLALILLLLVSCGTPQPTPTPTRTPMPPTPTAQGPSWDYVALGDSIAAQSRSYPYFYAAHIEADQGVRVRLNNLARNGMTSGDLLWSLRNLQPFRDAISEAEVVTVVIGVNDVVTPLVGPYKSGNCGGEDNRDCIRDALESFGLNYDAAIAEILALCSSQTMVRTMTYYYPDLADWGLDEDLRPFIEPMNDHIIQVASENNIPVALVHLVFNGPDGEQDPILEGYLVNDGLHPSELGATVIADLHQELGYEYTPR